MIPTSIVRVFSFTNYRAFLLAKTSEVRDSGVSFRTIASQCDLQSPNYLQLVIQGKRNLTVKTGRKIAVGLGMSVEEVEYFAKLVTYEHEMDGNKKIALLDELKVFVHRSQAGLEPENSVSLGSHWLHSVIFEMAGNRQIALTVESVLKRLGGLASRAEVANSLQFLIERGFLQPSPEHADVYDRKTIVDDSSNDVRRIEQQQNHLRYLEMAKRRVNDAQGEGEFQGFTIALPSAQMPLVKERIRSFIQDLNRDLLQDDRSGEVVRIQVAAFKVTG